MEPALEAYILAEHTEQLKEVKTRLHTVSNILTKEQLAWDSVEANIGKITEQLEKHGERLDELEKLNSKRETKISMFKQGLKFWPCVLLIIAVIDYSKVWFAIKSFLHLG